MVWLFTKLSSLHALCHLTHIVASSYPYLQTFYFSWNSCVTDESPGTHVLLMREARAPWMTFAVLICSGTSLYGEALLLLCSGCFSAFHVCSISLPISTPWVDTCCMGYIGTYLYFVQNMAIVVHVLESWSTVEVCPTTKANNQDDLYIVTHCKTSCWFLNGSLQGSCFTRWPKVWNIASKTVMYLLLISRVSSYFRPKVLYCKNTSKSLHPKGRLIIV